VDRHAATRYLVEQLPEFAPEVDYHLAFNGELLFHVLMGQLAVFYMDVARDQPELSRRVWLALDHLATEADDYVQNALDVSLVEYFAWGSDDEKAALRDATPLFSPAMMRIVGKWQADLAAPS
jgi:hypothetical protein